MNTTQESKPMSTFLYIKDMPDGGGLRAGRMKWLKDKIESAKRNGYDRLVVVDQGDGTFDAVPWYQHIRTCLRNDPRVREVYNVTMDIPAQLAASRAMNW